MFRTLLFFTLSVTGFTELSGQNFPTPMSRCWEFKSDQIINNKSASDNQSLIILPLNTSEIIALDQSGKILWTNEIGGEILSNLVIKDDRIFFAIQNSGEEKGFSLRSVGSRTGLTIWEQKIATSESIQTIEIINSPGSLLIATNNRYFYFIDEHLGSIITSEKIEDGLLSNIEVSQENIYFVNQKKQLINYSLKDKRSNFLFQFKVPINRLFLNQDNRILIVNSLNQITQINLVKMKKNWTVRLGGEVISITGQAGNYLVSSVDNYLYFISSKNGKFIWRKRTEGRTGGVFVKNQAQYISTVINGQTTYFSELKNGRTINQVTLLGDLFFTKKALILNELVILSSNRGIIAYSFAKC